MCECVRDSVISDWFVRKLMWNIQVAGVPKRIITKVSIKVTISSLQGHGRGKRGSKINGGHYEKVNRGWWKKGRPREKVCDVSVIWLWGTATPRFEILHIQLLTRLYVKQLPSFKIYTGNNKLCLNIKVHNYYEKFIWLLPRMNTTSLPNCKNESIVSNWRKTAV